jgi:hypothetical protein
MILRANPKVNYGRWVITMYQHRFNGCHKNTTLEGDVDIERQDTLGVRGEGGTV